MRPARPLLATALAALLCAPAASSAADPPVTRVAIAKGAHTLTLYAGDRPRKTYTVAIGPGGSGPKHREGDKITPVGHYKITMHQPSQFSLFLRLYYPSAADWARFNASKQSGELPKGATIGGDIGIHGTGNPEWTGIHKLTDWTLGCVALDNDEIAEIAAQVKDGTPVDISD